MNEFGDLALETLKQLKHLAETRGPETFSQIVTYYRTVTTLGVLTLVVMTGISGWITYRLNKRFKDDPDMLVDFLFLVITLILFAFTCCMTTDALAWWIAPDKEVIEWAAKLAK